jgi:hypothetical protein
MSAGHEETGVWRDEERTPLRDLDRALATYSSDGQADDVTGGDAGAEQEFGHDAVAGQAGLSGGDPGDPDPTSEEGRRLRPSFEGRSGPGVT